MAKVRKNSNIALLKRSEKKETRREEASFSFEELKGFLKSASSLQGKLVVVYLDSHMMSSDEGLSVFAENLSILSEAGVRFVVVHDYKIDHFIAEFDLPQYFSTGEFTPPLSPIMHEVVLNSIINKNIVKHLNSFGAKAIGISAKDGPIIVTEKTRVLKAADSTRIEHAKPSMIFPEILFEFEETSITPVISPVAFCENGLSTFVEPYQMTSLIAVNLAAEHLVLIGRFKEITKPFNTICFESDIAPLKFKEGELSNAIKYGLTNGDLRVHMPSNILDDSLLLSLLKNS